MIQKLKNYVGGKWIDPDNSGYIDVVNPRNQKVLAQVPLSTWEATNHAIDVATEAYKSWHHTPVARRVYWRNERLAIC